MNKKDIYVPIEIDYLSQWKDFDKELPPGKVILNKNICGCGCTEYYLRNDMPIVLVSPRKELLNCKMNSQRQRPLFYFDRSKSRKVKAEETIQNLQYYVSNQYSVSDFVPKILVTYDSLKMVIDTLENMGCFQCFTVIVDEFTCIFTDVILKGLVELNLIHMLNERSNRTIFISATPIEEKYLNSLEEFKDIPYVTLIWDKSRLESVSVAKQKMISTRSEISRIISDFRQNGYFKAKLIEGKQVNSTEAVFFLNSVTDIVAVIKNCGLTMDDTLVICADDEKNRTELRKVRFTIGHVPNRQEYKKKNKTFTFVTKASFEGTDFYSDCSSTYIFADSNRDNLCLDISIDMIQIIGRCRTVTNPFRLEINYFYKTTDTEEFDLAAARQDVEERMKTTERVLVSMKDINDSEVLRMVSTSQIVDKYRKNYADMQTNRDGTSCIVFNKLAWIADLRAIEIKSEQYKTEYTVLTHLENNGYDVDDRHSLRGDSISEFYNEFKLNSIFTRRMKLYIDTIEKQPELKAIIEGMADIPLKFKEFYNILGPVKIKALEYREAELNREIYYLQSIDNMKFLAVSRFVKGKCYSNTEVKMIIAGIYEELKLKLTPKATILPKLIPAEETKFTDDTGKRVNGFRIL